METAVEARAKTAGVRSMPKPQRRIVGAASALLVAAWVLCTLRPLWGIDLFWHVVQGDVIRELGTVHLRDTFSALRPERPWIPFQWGYQVLVSLVDDIGGLELLRWTHVGLHLAAFGLAASMAKRRIGAAAPLALALLMVAYLDRIRARPHVFNLLFALLLVEWVSVNMETALPAAGRKVSAYLRAALPLVLLAVPWANLHGGGSLLLPLVSGAFAAGLVLRRDPRAGLVAVAVAAPLLPMALSPGFLPGVVSATVVYQAGRELIPEWSSSFIYLTEPSHLVHPFMGMVPFVSAAALAAAARRAGWSCLPRLLPCLVLLGLSFATARFIYLATLVFWLWPETLAPLAASGRRIRAAVAAALVLGALFVHEIVWVQAGSPIHFAERIGRTLDPGRFCEESSDFLEEARVEGGVLHLSDWGGYLLYRHFPAIRVYADGRTNIGPDVVAHLLRSHNPSGRHAYLQRALIRYPADALIFPPPVFELDAHDTGRFLLVHADPSAEVYLVRGPRFDRNLDGALARLRGRGLRPPDPRKEPRAFELFVRHARARELMKRPELRAQRAAAEAAAGGTSKSAYAGALDLALWLERHGDLLSAEKTLARVANELPPTEALGSAARVRLAAVHVRLGAHPASVLALLDSVQPALLAPADTRLAGRVEALLTSQE